MTRKKLTTVTLKPNVRRELREEQRRLSNPITNKEATVDETLLYLIKTARTVEGVA